MHVACEMKSMLIGIKFMFLNRICYGDSWKILKKIHLQQFETAHENITHFCCCCCCCTKRNWFYYKFKYIFNSKENIEDCLFEIFPNFWFVEYTLNQIISENKPYNLCLCPFNT